MHAPSTTDGLQASPPDGLQHGALSDVLFVVVGAGGLGCPALLGLMAAGVSAVDIYDPDVVEASNLQRQVLYSLADVGRPKAEAAAWHLRRRAPSITARAHVRGITEADLGALFAALPARSIVLECSDDPALKFAVNDAGLRHGTPVVIGAALGLHGQTLSVAPGFACYRCIYEHPPTDAPSCAGAGVLGPAVGLAGFLMASAAVALCRGTEQWTETAGALAAIDSASGRVQTLRPTPRPSCTACAHARPSRFSADPSATT